jgi:hypothetical protein
MAVGRMAVGRTAVGRTAVGRTAVGRTAVGHGGRARHRRPHGGRADGMRRGRTITAGSWRLPEEHDSSDYGELTY